MKTMTRRKYFLQILTQFLQGNNVLDAAGSNVDSFSGRDTFVASSHLKGSIWREEVLSPP
jgi:hypothetical protein